MSNTGKFILLPFLFLFSLEIYAQTDEEKILLTEILIHLQNKYKYHFTYADDVVKDIFIENLPEDLTFEEVIEHLKAETGLYFQFLDNNFVAITPPDTSFYICGYLIGAETETPLYAATISGMNNHTISDSSGYFRLKVKQDDENICIRHIGYKMLNKPAGSFDKKNCSDIFMPLQSFDLSEVVLTHFITKGIDKMSDGIYNIHFKSFEILPGLIETDVLHTVQALPGIQSVNETVSSINIRGGTNDQNLLLWDEIRMYQPGHFFGLISAFSPLMTSDVSVVKNGSGADYTDGVSGTIAMKTNTEINDKISGSIGINSINLDAFVDIPLGKKSSLQLGARKAISNIIETPTYTKYFHRISQHTEVSKSLGSEVNSDINFDFYDVNLRWLYYISDKDHIRVNFIRISNDLVYYENAVVDQNEESKESTLIQNSIAGGIYYKRTWNERFSSTVHIYETDYTLKAINADIILQQTLLQENTISESCVKLNNWYKQSNHLSFLAGYQFTENGITNLTHIDTPLFKLLEREVIREHGLYAQASFMALSKKLRIKTGIRYSFIEKFSKHFIEPRININYGFNEHFNIEFLSEFKHQNVSQIINYQTDFLGIEKRRWRLANDEDIPVITSKQASVGFDYSKKGWLLSTEGYIKVVNGITSQSQGFLNQYIFEKAIGSYNVKGIEFLINKRNSKFSNWLSYTLADNEYTFDDFREVNFPNNIDVTHAVTFGSSFSTKGFKVSVGVNWYSGKPTTNPVQGNEVIEDEINYEPANSSNIDEYLRIDFSTTYDFIIHKNIRAHTGISIWNSLNRDNTSYEYYRLNGNDIINIKETGLKLTPNFIFRIKF